MNFMKNGTIKIDNERHSYSLIINLKPSRFETARTIYQATMTVADSDGDIVERIEREFGHGLIKASAWSREGITRLMIDDVKENFGGQS